MINIKDMIAAHKSITILLLITVVLSLSALLLVPASRNRRLPPGFSREAPVVVKSVPYKTRPGTQLRVSPKVVERVRKRITQDWGRDPFILLLTQVPEGYADLRVTAILITEDSKWACVNGQVMKVGDRLGKGEIIAIDKDGIKVSNVEGVQEIGLQP